MRHGKTTERVIALMNMLHDGKEFSDLREVADALGVSVATASRYLAAAKITRVYTADGRRAWRLPGGEQDESEQGE